MTQNIELLDVVALAADLPAEGLVRGEVGTVVERYPNNAFEVEFVAHDGYTYALTAIDGALLLPLRQKQIHTEQKVVAFTA